MDSWLQSRSDDVLAYHTDHLSLVTGLEDRLIEKKFCKNASHRPQVDKGRVYLGSEQDFRSSERIRIREIQEGDLAGGSPIPQCHDKLGHPTNTNWITEPSC